MIINTELEHKGNLFPTKITNYKKDVDTLFFTCENGVVLELTIVRDSVFRFRYTTTGTFDNDFRYFPTSSGDQITILAIPPIIFSENISRKSLRISGATYNLIDDGNGNIIDTNNSNVHVGNVLYTQGIITITNLDYENALIQ